MNKGGSMLYRHWLKITLVAAIVLMASGQTAFAQQTVGNIIINANDAWSGMTNIFSAIAWIVGAALGCIAIFKFKDHVDNPQQTPLSAGVKRMLAGGMLLSLPFSLQAMRGSLFGAQGVGSNSIMATGWTNVTSYSAGGLDVIIVKFMDDIAGPIEGLLTAFSYLAGIALLLVGITRLTKRMEEGPRGPAGFGTIMTFIASGALFSFGDSLGAFTSSMFGDSSLMSQITVDPTIMTNAIEAERVQHVLEAVEVFVMIVGYIAFIRGWFVLKNFADGQQGATMAQGIVFLVGGTLAINLGELINALQISAGLTGTALTFS